MQLRYRQPVTAAAVSVVALALTLGACSSSGSSSSSGGGASSSSSASSGGGSSKLSGTLNASGSTFQTNFQQAAIAQFKSIQSGMTVNYGGGGSGKGRTDLASGTVNFAGSDSPIPAKEASGFTGKTILYFPVIIGPITMAYNLSGVSSLKLSPATIAGIFSGKIKTWNDPAIKADNSGASLPSTPITVAVLGPRRQRQPGRGAGRQVHSRRHRVRGLRHGQGLRAERRLGQEQGRLLRRTVAGLGDGGRGQCHLQT